MKPSPVTWAAFVLILAAFTFTACRDQTEPTVSPPPVRPEPPAAGRVGVVPADWLPGPAVGGRLASHRLLRPDGAVADISLVLYQIDSDWLPGGLNAWRSQLGLEELSAGDLRLSATGLGTSAGPALVFDFEGRPDDTAVYFDGRLIAVAIERTASVWIFRIRGNPDLVGEQKQVFPSWAASVRPDEVEPPGAVRAEKPVVGSAPAGERFIHNVPAQAEIGWRAPDDWALAPDDAGKLARFMVDAGDAGTAAVSIWGRRQDTTGSPLEQIEHWQARTGSKTALPNAVLASASTIWTGRNRAFRLIEIEGETIHVLAAWTDGAQATWFFELEGPPAAVKSIAPAFAAFLQSATFETPADDGRE